MAKYHVRQEDGYVGICKAEEGKCPVDGGNAQHFTNPQEAFKAAEVIMEKKHNTTASASKKTRTRKAKPKKEFKIPENVQVEGYLGSIGFEGGNYSRLASDDSKNQYDTTVIAKELRNDIKNAVDAGFLPATIDGRKVSYSVRGSRNQNHVNISAKIDDTTLNREPIIKKGYAPGTQVIFLESAQEKEFAEVKNKLQEMHDSYNFNYSNAMVDYFDTNFYGGVNIEYSSGTFEKTISTQKKAIKSITDDFVEKNQEVDFDKEYPYDEKLAIVDKAIRENPKSVKAIQDWANATNSYTLARHTEDVAYDYSSRINDMELRGEKSYEEAKAEREEALELVRAVSEGSQLTHITNREKNSRASSLSEISFHDKVGSNGDFLKAEIVNGVFDSLERRGVRKKPRYMTVMGRRMRVDF